MHESNYLFDILQTLNKKKVAFIIFGGVAAVLHGAERVTMDLDISINMERMNVGRFIDAMNVLKLKPRLPVPAEVLLDPDMVNKMVLEKNALVFTFFDPDHLWRQVDIALAPHLSFSNLKQDVQKISINNNYYNVLNVKRLIELKKAVVPQREKDIIDIVALRKKVSEP